ncbi:MAG: copper resistance protein B [bacterium]
MSTYSKWFINVIVVFGLIVGTGSILRAGVNDQLEDRPDSELTAPLPGDFRSPGTPPGQGRAIRKYAVDDSGPGATNFGAAPVHDSPSFFTVRSDRLEYRRTGEKGNGVYLWDLQAWYGNDYDKIVLETEGEWEEDHSEAVELMYDRAITPFWNGRIGVRQLAEPEPERSFLVVGVSGVAPQWIETETNLVIGEDDDIRADLEAEYNLLFSQRLVLQPRLETEFAMQEQPEYGIGDGFTGAELGARLRYELSRKFAPYVGVSWETDLGETADITRRNGGDEDAFFFVTGVRFWY